MVRLYVKVSCACYFATLWYTVRQTGARKSVILCVLRWHLPLLRACAARQATERHRPEPHRGARRAVFVAAPLVSLVAATRPRTMRGFRCPLPCAGPPTPDERGPKCRFGRGRILSNDPGESAGRRGRRSAAPPPLRISVFVARPPQLENLTQGPPPPPGGRVLYKSAESESSAGLSGKNNLLGPPPPNRVL